MNVPGFPRIESETIAVPSTEHGEQPPLIALIALDDPLTEKVTAALLQAHYRVCRCDQSSIDVAGHVNCDVDPAVVIIEMSIPALTTDIDLLTEACRRQMPQGLPVILVGSRGDLPARLAALRAGAARYLCKPVDADRLLAALDEIVGYRHDDDRYCVLLVDDDRTLLKVHGSMLETAGMKVYPLFEPMQLLEQVERIDPDVLLLNIHMPNVSGPELAAVLREREAQRHMPILFLSGQKDAWMQPLAFSLGSDDFLEKPVRPERLVAAVVARAHRARQIRATHRRLQGLVYEREREHQAIDHHAIVSIADAAGRIIYANDRFCAISGYRRDELLGQDHRMVNSGQHPPGFFRAMWRYIAYGQVWQGEICNRSKDGHLYWVSSTITPFLDSEGRPYQYVSIRTDVTGQVMAREALRASQAELSRRVWDSDKRARESACLSSVVQVLLDETLTVDEILCEAARRIPAGWAEPSETYACIHLGETNYTTPGFRKGQCVQRASIPGDPEGRHGLEVHRCGSTCHESHQAAFLPEEQALLDAIALQIFQALMRRRAMAAIVSAREEAERANRAKSDFLSNMSHELRTPMNAILGFGQLLCSEASLPPQQRDNLDEIMRAGEHLLQLINQVLDLSKVESGRFDLSLEPVAIKPLVDECMALLMPLAHQRSILLRVNANPQVTVLADRVCLKQVLLNFLSNAIKYNRDSGTVIVTTEPGNPDGLRIAVTDTGAGIAKDRLGELFQPFNRLGAERGGIEGTGIGLAFSRRVAELMNGRVGVCSTAGTGSAFWVELPVVKPCDSCDPQKTAPAMTEQPCVGLEQHAFNLQEGRL